MYTSGFFLCSIVFYRMYVAVFLVKIGKQSVSLTSDGIVTGKIQSRWERQRASDSLSPDKQWIAYSKHGNIFIQPATGGEAVQCTVNGDTTHPYGQMWRLAVSP
jgi:hypothetical protein